MGLNDEYQLGVYIGMLMNSESIISMVMKKRTDCSKYISSTDLTCFIPMIRMTLLLQFHKSGFHLTVEEIGSFSGKAS